MLVGKVRDTQIMFSFLVQAQLVEAESITLPLAQPSLKEKSQGETKSQ